MPSDITPGLNPDEVLGENRNATSIYVSNLIPTMCLGPHGSDGSRARSTTAQMTAELRELDTGGIPGRIFAGSADTDTVSARRLANFGMGSTALTTELIPGAIHDMLGTDKQALDNINRIFTFVDGTLETWRSG